MGDHSEPQETSLNDYFQRVHTPDEQAPLERPSSQRQDDEESGLRYFVSEPSMTSEGDQSESVHRDRILSLLSPVRDQNDDDGQQELSPGGTSLSSKESLLVGAKLVQVQCAPEQQAWRSRVPLPYFPTSATERPLEDTSKVPPLAAGINGGPDRNPHERWSSTSMDSRGAAAPDVEMAAPSPDHQVDLVSDAETDKVDNSVASMSHTVEADETIVMTLSETDDDEVRTKDTEITPLDWEQQHSADDEHTPMTTTRQHRKRWVPSNKITNAHRRTRSGDAAAASLMTGGLDWKGMQRDQLPIPPPHADDGEEDDEMVETDELPQHPIEPIGEAVSFDQQWLDLYPGSGNVASSRIASIGGRWQRSVGQKSPRQGLELSVTAPELTPDAFSQFALQSNTPREGQTTTSWRDSYSRIEYRPNGQYGQGPMRGPSTYGRGHGRFPSETSWHSAESSMTRESGISWPSAPDRLPMAPGANQASTFPVTRQASPSESSQYDDDDASGSYCSDTEEEERNVMHNRLPSLGHSLQELPEAERLLESQEFGGVHRVVRHGIVSPFGIIGKSSERVPLSSFRVTGEDTGSYPTFVCPRCSTVQRQFFTVATAPSQFESPAGYLAIYFGIYVMAALYIFGLEEGWAPLDCVYFAVITLTTAGLGDFVPTSDSAKIICSIFIYFGVACIGLLLGTYLAGMMDDKSEEEAKRKRVENCTNCARLQDIKIHHQQQGGFASSSRDFSSRDSSGRTVSGRRESMVSSMGAKRWISERPLGMHGPGEEHVPERNGGGVHVRRMSESLGSISEDIDLPESLRTPKEAGDKQASDNREVINRFDTNPQMQTISPRSNAVLGSPMTTKILRRQSRTRHMSIGHDQDKVFFGVTSDRIRKTSEDLGPSQAIPEGKPFAPTSSRSIGESWRHEGGNDDEGDSAGEESVYSTSSSLSEEVGAMKAPDRVKTAKYIFLTLKQALMNSILIIVIGGIGFHTIEKMTFVDSFYFTTVLLTTVGYGDLHPVTSAGKLFATVYVLVAGTVLLNNMSLISMIPLELRKRRLERVVLSQFGDQLDDVTLRELATGPLIRRLQLSHNPSTTGLDECTREMFALAMLVRLGKVTERDIRQTFAAFRLLDVDNDGVLSSKSIIAGMMAAKRRESIRRAGQMGAVPPPPPFGQPPLAQQEDYWYDDHGGVAVPSPMVQPPPQFESASHDHRRSFSLSPQFRPSERSSLYPAQNHGRYDSFPHEEYDQPPYGDVGYHDARLSSSLV